MKLGDVFDISKSIGTQNLSDGTLLYEFTPTVTFRSFNRYYVLITPASHKIYCIWAEGPFDSTDTAKREQALLMKLLKQKYGDGKKQEDKPFDALLDINRIDNGNRYIITKVNGIFSITLEIRYNDSSLENLATQEDVKINEDRVKANAKKVDSTGL